MLKLQSKGLVVSPLRNLEDKNNKYHCMTCFPWFVVEFKHLKAPIPETEHAYCQAANGSSTCLDMLDKLSKYAQRQEEEAHLMPIPALTCVGHSVKLWLTYIYKAGDRKAKVSFVLPRTIDLTRLS
jgi:hypothetical protein